MTRKSSLQVVPEQSLADSQNCQESFPERLTKGCFQARAARTQEFEVPSQQYSSQIPLRCLPDRNPRNTSFLPASGRKCFDWASGEVLESRSQLVGILVRRPCFFKSVYLRTGKHRSILDHLSVESATAESAGCREILKLLLIELRIVLLC